MKLILEFDDFSPRNSNLGLLEDLKDHYKDFKVVLFTTPWEIRFGEMTPITDEKFKPFCEAIKRAEDWIEIALHGLTHNIGEFKNISYEDAKKRISAGEKMLINRGIKFAKIFKAPHWQLSDGGRKAAEELGYKVVDDGYYNWNLKDDFPKKLNKKEVVIGHGHIQNTMGNGLEEVMPRLLEIPTKGTEFMFLSDYLGATKVDSPKVMKALRKMAKEEGNGRPNN